VKTNDPTAAQIRAQAQVRSYRASNTNQRPGVGFFFWKGILIGLPLTASLWLVLWLVFRH
jgi:hypothetical protein